MYEKYGRKICTKNMYGKYVRKIWTKNIYEKYVWKIGASPYEIFGSEM